MLAGWVARRRDHGGVVFIDLRDAGGVELPTGEIEVSEDVRVHPRRDRVPQARLGT